MEGTPLNKLKWEKTTLLSVKDLFKGNKNKTGNADDSNAFAVTESNSFTYWRMRMHAMNLLIFSNNSETISFDVLNNFFIFYSLLCKYFYKLKSCPPVERNPKLNSHLIHKTFEHCKECPSLISLMTRKL